MMRRVPPTDSPRQLRTAHVLGESRYGQLGQLHSGTFDDPAVGPLASRPASASEPGSPLPPARPAMWLITPIGFFSAVQKSGTDHLTVRARVAADLDALRALYLPTLSPTQAGGGTDYPYRATCSHEAWGEALRQMALALDYDNVKSRVSATQGSARAHIYEKVWHELHGLSSLPVGPAKAPSGKSPSFGAVVIDEQGRILLQKPSNNFDGGAWTFPKGRPQANELPEEAARREVQEETGWQIELLDPIPGTFIGTTSINRYWLARPTAQVGHGDWESEAIRWASPEQARALLLANGNATKRVRDLSVLEAALALVAARVR